MFGLLKDKLMGGAKKLSGKTDLLEACCAAVVMVGAADGDFSDDEAIVGLDRVQSNDAVSKAFSASQIEEAFNKQAKRAKSGVAGRVGLRKEIEECLSKSTADEREMIFCIACDVANADGDVGAKEMETLKTIGKLLGGYEPKAYLS